MKLFSLLNPQYHRFFDIRIAKEIGLNEALLLQELIYKHDYWQEQDKLELDGSFFVTQEDIENDTTLSPYQQTQAIKTLVSKGLISVNKHGMPPVNYYQVSESTFSSFLGDIDQVSRSTLARKLETTNISCTKDHVLNNNTISSDIVATKPNSKKVSQEERFKKALETDTKDIGAIFYWIENLQKSQEFIEALKKWYNAVGKGFHLGQLKMRLNDLYNLFTEEKDQIDRINLCYMKGYATFVFKTDSPAQKVYKVNNVTVDEDNETLALFDFGDFV